MKGNGEGTAAQPGPFPSHGFSGRAGEKGGRMMKRVLYLVAMGMSVIMMAGTAWGDVFLLNCKYKINSYTVFENGKYKDDKDNEYFSFTITIDTNKENAFLTGNSGTVELMMFGNEDQISLMQIIGQYPAIFTTLTTIYLTPTKDNKFPSSHSRHNRFNSVYTSSQYTGFCETPKR